MTSTKLRGGRTFVPLMALLALGVGIAGCSGDSPSTRSVSGTIETDEVRVASRYGGRVEKILALDGTHSRVSSRACGTASTSVDAVTTAAASSANDETTTCDAGSRRRSLNDERIPSRRSASDGHPSSRSNPWE